MSSAWKDLWDLDPETVYLNHGSFGPSPRPILDAFHNWSERLERQPMRFFCTDMDDLLEETATALAAFLKTTPDRIALTDNATFAMNAAACSIPLADGDEVLLTDHEYGAVRRIWQRRCQQTGARLSTVHLPRPCTSEATVEAVRQACSKATRVIVVSQITSATAIELPVADICRFARKHRITSIVDGPHALVQLDVRPDDIGCDFYCASCHKWLCAAFGSGFLWAHPAWHQRIRFPLVSWGGSLAGKPPRWQDQINWLGTRNPAALLSISAALDFFKDGGVLRFREHARRVLTDARERLASLEGVSTFAQPSEKTAIAMLVLELPRPLNWKPGYTGQCDPLQHELRTDFGIEVPVMSWGSQRLLRISAHLYNTPDDVERLATALDRCVHLRN